MLTTHVTVCPTSETGIPRDFRPCYRYHSTARVLRSFVSKCSAICSCPFEIDTFVFVLLFLYQRNTVEFNTDPPNGTQTGRTTAGTLHPVSALLCHTSLPPLPLKPVWLAQTHLCSTMLSYFTHNSSCTYKGCVHKYECKSISKLFRPCVCVSDECGVMEQKEEGSRQTDSHCGIKTKQGHAGLCE